MADDDPNRQAWLDGYRNGYKAAQRVHEASRPAAQEMSDDEARALRQAIHGPWPARSGPHPSPGLPEGPRYSRLVHSQLAFGAELTGALCGMDDPQTSPDDARVTCPSCRELAGLSTAPRRAATDTEVLDSIDAQPLHWWPLTQPGQLNACGADGWGTIARGRVTCTDCMLVANS